MSEGSEPDRAAEVVRTCRTTSVTTVPRAGRPGDGRLVRGR